MSIEQVHTHLLATDVRHAALTSMSIKRRTNVNKELYQCK